MDTQHLTARLGNPRALANSRSFVNKCQLAIRAQTLIKVVMNDADSVASFVKTNSQSCTRRTRKAECKKALLKFDLKNKLSEIWSKL